MEHAKSVKQAKARVARHRSQTAAKGSKRVEVTVPTRDASLVKAMAGALCNGGAKAKHIRESIQPLVAAPKAKTKTGAELVAFFRNSPLVEAELSLERNRSGGRSVDLD